MREISISFIRIIKDRLNILEVARYYNIQLNDKDFTRCMFHTEKTASLKFYKNRNRFKCMGCGKGGDIVDFVGELFSLNSTEAIKRIDLDFHLGLFNEITPEEKKKILEKQRKIAKEDEKKKEKARKKWHLLRVIREYEKIVEDNTPSRDEEPSELLIWCLGQLAFYNDYYDIYYKDGD